jgi:hypothetical protein
MATILAERAITGKPIGFAADHRIAVARYDAEYRGR